VDDVIPLVEALVAEEAMLARVDHGAALHGYHVNDHGGDGGDGGGKQSGGGVRRVAIPGLGFRVY
jgi:hypothetical protein